MRATQTTLLEEFTDTWTCADDWETPDAIAQRMASYVQPEDSVIVEPMAGTGQIVQYLPDTAIAIERNPLRATIGSKRTPHQWHTGCAFVWAMDNPGAIDLVVTNPAFSAAAELINYYLPLLSERGRMVLLLPCDTFHKRGVVEAITHPFRAIPEPIVGRVAYLKNGRPVHGRQVNDSIFTITKD